MRVIVRIDAWPTTDDADMAKGMFATMLEELRRLVDERWPGFNVDITTIVGYEDDAAEARRLLAERWVSQKGQPQ